MAARLKALRAEGHDLVVVVSAMGDTTDELLQLAAQITLAPPRRELDMLLTAGERISMALLSMALNAVDSPAISFTGSQSGIITDTGHGQARIQEIRPVRIREELKRGRIVIIAGFQGVSRDREVTTLGRGGSDTSAVALAVAFEAAECAIYTDVDGVFTADPRKVPEARLIPRIDFDTMLEFSNRGAGVINVRAVELARKFRMPLFILNSLRDGPGTRVEGDSPVEGTGIVGVTSTPRVIRVRLTTPPAEEPADLLLPRLAAVPLEPLVCDTVREQDAVHLDLILPGTEATQAFLSGLDPAAWSGAGCSLRIEPALAAVSLVANGPLRPTTVAQRAGAALTRAGIPVFGARTETLSYTLLVPEERGANAVTCLHAEFLDAGRSGG